MKVTAGGCEDSLNIVNSTGSLEVIAIIDSFSDAVDNDFSQIEIDKLDIVTAGNDCFDVSGGDYYILNANLVNCGDKGISVGGLLDLDWFQDQLKIQILEFPQKIFQYLVS